MKSSVEGRLIERMRRFTEDLKGGVDVEQKYTVTRLAPDQATTPYDGPAARSVRDLLNVSQPVFARFLGVSPNTVKAWEQGTNRPSGMASRILDAIRDDPQSEKCSKYIEGFIDLNHEETTVEKVLTADNVADQES